MQAYKLMGSKMEISSRTFVLSKVMLEMITPQHQSCHCVPFTAELS
jgi:hypothetical protein